MSQTLSEASSEASSRALSEGSYKVLSQASNPALSHQAHEAQQVTNRESQQATSQMSISAEFNPTIPQNSPESQSSCSHYSWELTQFSSQQESPDSSQKDASVTSCLQLINQCESQESGMIFSWSSSTCQNGVNASIEST